jgi:Ni/Fe-hydrogenase subunit HybB-like protein
MNRVKNAKLILWLITGFAAAVILNRFIFGLGVTTNLNDTTPWGFWIGFDVMAGVALAAGGFIITAFFYILKREDFHPLVKPAVLTAFLGYLAVITGLTIDLGLPWNIWHMIIFWNPKSPLFEVGWCVMIYTAILFFEFSPVPLEKYSRYAKVRIFLMKFRFVFVLLGIMLSTLHQSSLGTLFLIMPFKLYPLWYSNILPVEFLVSAAGLGLMVVAFESLFSHWLYKRKPESDLIAKLCKAASWVLLVFFIIKITDIIVSSSFDLIFNGSWQSNLFIFELFISTIFPALIFSNSKLCQKSGIQWTGSIMVIFGMVLNRIDVGGLAMLGATGDSYIPSWKEISISFGIISAAALVFLFVMEKFQIWEKEPTDPESLSHTLPSFDFPSKVWLGTPGVSNLSRHSLAFVISFALGIALLSVSELHSKGIDSVKVVRASGIDTLIINGNRDDQFVVFPHQDHIARLGKDRCMTCHHLSLPGYQLNNCSECHTSMYKPVEFFNHDWHTSPKGANLKCSNCHAPGTARNVQSAKGCIDCHQSYKLTKSVNKSGEKYFIPSYTNAMHRMCLSCHAKESIKVPAGLSKNKRDLTQCSTCHALQINKNQEQNLNWEVKTQHFNNVILPEYDKP